MRLPPCFALLLLLSACGSQPAARSSAVAAPAATLAVTPAPAAAPVVTPPSATAPVADPPPLRVALVDDERWQGELDQLLAAEVPRGDARRGRWLRIEHYLASEARDYVRSEGALRELMELRPDDPLFVADLSVALGKQGRYADALAAVDRALAMPGVNAMHAHAVRASWLWHLGRRDEARAEFGAVPTPAAGDDEWPLYQGCRACFAASSHDLPTLRDSLLELKRLGDEHLDFPRRDVIFDQYRAEPWFTELVGDTLAPQM